MKGWKVCGTRGTLSPLGREDFFHTTVPYFFDSYGDLNPNVGFAQCPKYFPHVQAQGSKGSKGWRPPNLQKTEKRCGKAMCRSSSEWDFPYETHGVNTTSMYINVYPRGLGSFFWAVAGWNWSMLGECVGSLLVWSCPKQLFNGLVEI